MAADVLCGKATKWSGRGGGEDGGGGGGSGGSGLKAYELPVHARVIERRSVVRRMRERGAGMSMERLMRMMGEMGGDELGEKDTRWRKGKGRRRMEGRGGRAVFGGGTTEGVERLREAEGGVDDDTGDELSFLIERCELNADDKQAAFMPYIT